MPVDPIAAERDRARSRAREQANRTAARWVRINHPDVWARMKREADQANGLLPNPTSGDRAPFPRPVRGRPRRPREHGTPLGYKQHRRDGDDPCDACRAAIHAYQKRFPSQQPGRKRTAAPAPWPAPDPDTLAKPATPTAEPVQPAKVSVIHRVFGRRSHG